MRRPVSTDSAVKLDSNCSEQLALRDRSLFIAWRWAGRGGVGGVT